MIIYLLGCLVSAVILFLIIYYIEEKLTVGSLALACLGVITSWACVMIVFLTAIIILVIHVGESEDKILWKK